MVLSLALLFAPRSVFKFNIRFALAHFGISFATGRSVECVLRLSCWGMTSVAVEWGSEK